MMDRIKKLLHLVLILCLSLAFVAPGAADARKKPKRITIKEEAVIKGKIVRPEMAVMVQRSKMNYEALKLNESFLDRIIHSVKTGDF